LFQSPLSGSRSDTYEVTDGQPDMTKPTDLNIWRSQTEKLHTYHLFFQNSYCTGRTIISCV